MKVDNLIWGKNHKTVTFITCVISVKPGRSKWNRSNSFEIYESIRLKYEYRCHYFLNHFYVKLKY